MKFNKWTLALAAAGVLNLGSAVQAEEAAQNQVLTALTSTTLSGYVSTSAIWKFGTGNANLPGRSYDGPSKQDSFNLDVVKLSLEKPLDESQWSAGYKAELLFGPDASTFNTASAPPYTSPADEDFAIKQAYVALRAPVGNGIDFKLGVWTPLSATKYSMPAAIQITVGLMPTSSNRPPIPVFKPAITLLNGSV
jgi:hypothetical protein